MGNKWILTFESWPLCTDALLKEAGEKLICAWSHGKHTINAMLVRAKAPVLHIKVTENGTIMLNTKAKSFPHVGGWIFRLKLEGKKLCSGGFDRSNVIITITPDSALRKLFSNAPFGLSYMPVVRFYLEKRTPKNVLEWGGGRSTLMFAESLQTAQIFTVEHHPEWYTRILLLAGRYPQVTPIHEPLTLKPGKSGKYVTAPLYLHRKFDLVFIDGRLRTDCIAISRQVLAPGGIVFVHDAGRTVYHQAYCFFGSVKIVNDTAVLSD